MLGLFTFSLAAQNYNIDNCLANNFILFQRTHVDETSDYLLNCTEKILNDGGLAKSGAMSSECKLCNNMAAQLRKQKQVNSPLDASCSNNDGKQPETWLMCIVQF